MKEKLGEIVKQYQELMKQMQDNTVVSDFDEYQKLCKRQKKMQPIIEAHEAAERTRQSLASTRKMVVGEGDEELVQMAGLEIEELSALLDKQEAELEELMKPRDERDEGNVIMEIRPAAGGDEAGLFAAALLRMYTMYAQSLGFSVEVNHLNESEIGGLKEAALTINGDGAFAKFKYESGVHRVQRVPETETQGRIHTSTATVAVLPEAVSVDFKVDDKDLRVDVYRASGAGGQHVNKTESAIRITHLPTNTVVTCQDNRSQIKNRERAMVILQAKLADFYQSQEDEKYAKERKTQVGTGDRSERIRTYNFPQGRVTDHRIGKSVYTITAFMNGDIEEMVAALKGAGEAT